MIYTTILLVDSFWEKSRTVATLMTFCIVAILETGCAGAERQISTLEQFENSGSIDTHLIRSERLRQIMHRLDSVIYERESTALDVDAARIRRAAEIAGILSTMTDEIIGLATIDTSLNLSAREQALFVQYATELGEYSTTFSGISETRKVETFVPAINQVMQTCNVCHGLFRDNQE